MTRDILTGLRGIAALWVVVYHLREASANGGTGLFDFGPADALIAHGYLGVDLFFVLSGFIIRHVYAGWFIEQVTPHDYVRFLRYRIARLYPAHIVTLVLMLALYGVARAIGTHPHNVNSYSIFSLLNNLTLTHAWWGALGSPNTPAWSISAEWFAYLLFPLGYWLVSRRPLVTALILVPLCLICVGTPADGMPPLVRIGCEFSLGVAVFELRSRGTLSPLAGCVAAVALVGTTYWNDLPVEALAKAGLYETQVQIALLGLMIAALNSDRDALGHWLSRPWPLYFGEISYSIYMVHWFVLAVLQHGAAYALPQLNQVTLPFLGLCVVLTLLAASFLYRFVEAPGRRLLREPIRIGWHLIAKAKVVGP